MNRPITALLTGLSLLAAIGCSDDSDTIAPVPEGQHVLVAIYADYGTCGNCVRASERMFQWMGCTVVRITASYLNSTGPAGFDILCIPGGDMYVYAQDISPAGKLSIRRFVSSGGAYIGICGGAYFASERVVWRGAELAMTPLRLFAGTAEGVLNEVVPYPYYGMSQIKITNHDHPITQSESDSTWILYYWGPGLYPNADAEATVLGVYERVPAAAALVAFEYGSGRVFLSGTHPEFEEDDERDGVAFADDLDDRGSDWGLMRKAVLWCLKIDQEVPSCAYH